VNGIILLTMIAAAAPICSLRLGLVLGATELQVVEV
jgi:hypothetical protein